MPVEEVIIIGAGPSGLSLGFELERRGIVPLILERGKNVGTSWRYMYDDLHLGPWVSSTLPGSSVPFVHAYRFVPRSEYVGYLESYAMTNVSRIQTGVTVNQVRVVKKGFELETTSDTHVGLLVVNATGYFSSPYIPIMEGADSTRVPQMHSADYRSPLQLTSQIPLPGRVLVVGGNLSAGEMVVRLFDTGYEVDVSTRRPLRFGRSPGVQRIAAPAYFAVENALVRRNPHRLRDSRREMDGGKTRRLLTSGAVGVVPEVAVVDENKVEFIDGTRGQYDLILYATGYRPHLDHLAGLLTVNETNGHPMLSEMEAADTRGLFFLGLDNERNFRSRFIRGIRQDAGVLADRLVERLRSFKRDARRLA